MTTVTELHLPSGTPAVLAHPAPSGLPRRAVVIVPDIWGLRPLFADLSESLANRTGWTVGSFEPFPGLTLPGATDAGGYDARSAALRTLTDDRLLGDAVALAAASGEDATTCIGFCMGGMYALKAAGTGRFDTTVSFYGMARVPEAWAGPGQGEPLRALADASGCRSMAVVGGRDPWTPDPDVEALRQAGVTVVRYPEADHGFVHDPSRPTHRAEDAADAWDRAIAFIAEATGASTPC